MSLDKIVDFDADGDAKAKIARDTFDKYYVATCATALSGRSNNCRPSFRRRLLELISAIGQGEKL